MVQKGVNFNKLTALGCALTWTVACCVQANAQSSPTAQQSAPDAEQLNEVIVSASAFPLARSQIASTIQVIDQDAIRRSGDTSITDIFADNAGGFLSQWTPDQTSINIRGGASDGQGRDYLSDVLVLINGRPAGTDNLSKLSLNDVERIEIIRGPASVIYGSQNIGGVINIILKDGQNTQGGTAALAGGSWNLYQGHVEYAGTPAPFDYYMGASGGEQGNYAAGAGGSTERNTQWHRAAGTGSFGVDLDNDNRVDFMVRSDGCYDCGFRGSQANIYDQDDRYNQSADLTYSGHTNANAVLWSVHPFVVQDADIFNWASPIVVSSNKPVPGTASDVNVRFEDIFGDQLRTQIAPVKDNSLTLGWDWKYTRLRSTRVRVGEPGSTTAQVSPYDNNQHEYVNGLYLEDAQGFLDNRLTIRGGVRWTTGRTTLDPTPFLVGAIFRTEPYTATTYSAGLAYEATDWWLLRFGASSGFRAPDATQLAGEFTAVGGGRTFGNPSLTPETSHQVELGTTFSGAGNSLDVALFQNIITDRITTAPIAGVTNTNHYINEAGNVVVEGVEVQGSVDTLRAIRSGAAGPAFWTVYANGYYNFDMVDEGAVPTGANTSTLARSYRYEGTIGTRFGETESRWKPWSAGVSALLRGPVWINPVSGPEYLLIPQEFSQTYYLEKGSFWMFNLEGNVALSKSVDLSAFVDNLFNLNNSPIFFGLDRRPFFDDQRFLNGGDPGGTSMPGRSFQIRVRARF